MIVCYVNRNSNLPAKCRVEPRASVAWEGHCQAGAFLREKVNWRFLRFLRFLRVICAYSLTTTHDQHVVPQTGYDLLSSRHHDGLAVESEIAHSSRDRGSTGAYGEPGQR